MVGVFMFFVLISCPKLVIVISRIIIMFLFAHGASGGTKYRIYVAIPICFHKKKLLVNC